MLEAILPAAAVPATGWAVHTTVLYRQLRAERRDPITGLLDRRTFVRRADRLIRRGAVDTVVFLDLDDFKPVNDDFGHDAGDAALTAVGHRLHDYLGGQGLASRLGGDEFAVFAAVGADLEAFVEGLRTAVSRPVPWPGGPLAIGATVGTVRLADLPEPSVFAGLKAADELMLDLKGSGRRGRSATRKGVTS